MAWACGPGHLGRSEPLRLEEISGTVGRKSTHATGTVPRHTGGTLTAATAATAATLKELIL